SSLKAGDRVRTIGGIYGTIGTIKDDTVILLVGPDKVKLVFARGAIAQVEEAGVENEMTQEVMK
ncbi:MAG TPA: preprotein translocase subunit YajC, partial [Clostridia bacterium]|nr:preprotein translocase subunit YajC [Clostridia bacterium]